MAGRVRSAGMVALSAATVTLGWVAVAAPSQAAAPTRAATVHPWQSHVSSAEARTLASDPDQRVIVLLRDQQSTLMGIGREALRARAVRDNQQPLLSQLAQVRAPRVHGYSLINAVAATVSKAEVSYLRSDPAVLAVVPDAVVHGPSTDAGLIPAGLGGPATWGTTAAKSSSTTASPRTAPATGGTTTAGTATAGTAAAPADLVSHSVASGSQTCPAAGKRPLLEPEALSAIRADSETASTAPTAHSLGYSGAGVSIAVFPEGVDTALPDFQRDGKSAITDYQDFTGEGTSAVTGGGEAFLDVSSLVAQGKTVYNLQQEINPAFAGSSSCDIRVLGVAPGADVDVMKVFGYTNATYDSTILQGVEWAVTRDHVNILSQSLGENDLPNPGTDPLSLMDQAAVADGTVVVASTGDASPSNTEGEPALAPGVIAAAASTTFQIDAQTNQYLYDVADAVLHKSDIPSYRLGQSSPGWESDNVSTLSSSGSTEKLTGPTILAPGDLNWVDCSTNVSMYTDCGNYLGGSNIGLAVSGGTSESAPLTAGVAALVIQAYRESHHGATPDPSRVEQFITSGATDLAIPGDEQGAGELNALGAVELARSFGTTTATGGLLHGPASISAVGAPGSRHSAVVYVANNSTKAQTVRPVLRTLGPGRNLSSGALALYDSRSNQGFPTTCNGIETAKYADTSVISELNCKTFVVPAGTDYLDSRIAWNPLAYCGTDSNGNSLCTAGPPTVREILIDPSGRYTQYSDPQGDGAGFADAQVRVPEAGAWTLLVFSRPSSPYNGSVNFAEIGSNYQAIGGVFSPAAQVVAPGRTVAFTASIPVGGAPGDYSDSVTFGTGGTLPVETEAEVPLSAGHPGSFSGTLLGGNGRPSTFGQELDYQFQVPAGVTDLNADATAASDGYLLLGELVSPQNEAVDVESSYTAIDGAPNGSLTRSTHLTAYHPAAGRWTLVLATADPPTSPNFSGLTSTPVSGVVSLTGAPVTASGVPAKASYAAGSTHTATLRVTNTGAEPETFFVDPRQTDTTSYAAPDIGGPATGSLPLTTSDPAPQYLVPPLSSTLVLSASTTGTTPIDFTTSPYWGSPEYFSASGQSVSITVHSPITSEWALPPTEVGPFPSGATSEDYTTTATVATPAFDETVSSSDLAPWAQYFGGAAAGKGLFLNPGRSGTITVTFTAPSSGGGSFPDSGDLVVEGINPTGFPGPSASVYTEVPYSYTVAAG